MAKISSYKDLIVWQKSMTVCEMVYKVTSSFPDNEMYGLVSQIRRCAVSIPSNIAEGNGRSRFSREYKQFLHISYGSCQELETQLILSLRLHYISRQDHDEIVLLLTEVSKMLNTLLYKKTV